MVRIRPGLDHLFGAPRPLRVAPSFAVSFLRPAPCSAREPTKASRSGVLSTPIGVGGTLPESAVGTTSPGLTTAAHPCAARRPDSRCASHTARLLPGTAAPPREAGTVHGSVCRRFPPPRSGHDTSRPCVHAAWVLGHNHRRIACAPTSEPASALRWPASTAYKSYQSAGVCSLDDGMLSNKVRANRGGGSAWSCGPPVRCAPARVMLLDSSLGSPGGGVAVRSVRALFEEAHVCAAGVP